MPTNPTFRELENSRLEDVRWRLLAILNTVPGRIRAESTLAFDLIAAHLSLTDTELRGELEYLEGYFLISHDADYLDRRQYKITAQGRDVVEYRIACPPGIRRPPAL
jgi:RIO-like serine/threonine protein kinase